MSLYLTPEDFRRNPENVVALRDFLESPAGQALAKVMLRMRPETIAGDSRVAKDAPNLRAAAVSAGDPARASYLLGRIEGHEALLRLIVEELPQGIQQNSPRSSKLGGKRTDIKPHTPPTQ